MKTPNGGNPANVQDPTRWQDLPPTGSGPETEIGAAIRLMRGGPRAPERRVPFVGRVASVRAGKRTRSGWSLLRPARAGRAVLIGGSLLIGGMAAALSGKFIQHFNDMRTQPASAPKSATQSGVVHRKARTVDAPIGAPTPPPVDVLAPAIPAPPPPAPSLSRRPVRRAMAMVDRGHDLAEIPAAAPPPAERPVSLPTEPPAPLPFSPALGASAKPPTAGTWIPPAVRLRPEPLPVRPRVSEAALIARALERLRRDHDPLWALDDLDEHDRRYPQGQLNREAALTRAEALLELKRGDDALVVLDKVKLEPTVTDRRAWLARAELRAQDGRRAEAVGDFDRVLDIDGDDALAARALYGRAVCRVRGGDLGSARTDLRDYRRRFPGGAHHAEVEKMLRGLGG